MNFLTANIVNTLLHKNAQYLGTEYQKMLMAILKMSDSTRRYLLNNIIPENRDVQLCEYFLNKNRIVSDYYLDFDYSTRDVK